MSALFYPPVRRLTLWGERALPFGISLVFHLTLLLVLALVVFEPVHRSPIIMQMTPVEPVPVDGTEVADPAVVEAPQADAVVLVSDPEFLSENDGVPDMEIDEPFSADFHPVSYSEPLDESNIADLLQDVRPAGGDGDDAGANAVVIEEFEGRLGREGADQGDVQISLIWHNYNDLDLHVRTPSGEVIYYRHKRALCGGQLDVDMNVRGTILSLQPVENVCWQRAPQGMFTVSVNHYSNNGSPDPSWFAVMVKVADRPTEIYRGNVTYGQSPKTVCEFSNDAAWP